MAKVIKYNFVNVVSYDHGTQTEEIMLSATLEWSEANEEIAKREAYNGEYTIVDDGMGEKPPKEDTDTGGGCGIPSNALVDISPYMDKAVGLSWERRIDGTCSYSNEVVVDIYASEVIEGDALFLNWLELPFDLYDFTVISTCIDVETGETTALADYITVKAVQMELPNNMELQVIADNGLVKKMNELELEMSTIICQFHLNGRWWKEGQE